jgi:predicted TPR repeat methyltransferase
MEQALEDTMKAIDIDSLHGRAWRILADVKEAKGDIVEAMDAVSKWADLNPEFHVKATKELERLRLTAGSSS